ncbi:MAG TPA: hypothetical protein VL494_07690 [Steroidobacteraceae bacterium]|nr:hypothetical protein [Steroidobacteraceae bacterium]
MERLFVVVEDFVDAQLVDGLGGGADQRQQAQEKSKKSRAEARPTAFFHGRYSLMLSAVTSPDRRGSREFGPDFLLY